jgi:hypothetical protein
VIGRWRNCTLCLSLGQIHVPVGLTQGHIGSKIPAQLARSPGEAQVNSIVVPDERFFCEGLSQQATFPKRLFSRYGRQNNGELISTNTGQNIAASGIFGQKLAELPQHVIPRAVAIYVIDGFESVDIQEKETRLGAVTFGKAMKRAISRINARRFSTGRNVS